MLGIFYLPCPPRRLLLSKRLYMARNLIGYFGGKPDCNQYSVKIIADPSLATFDEIYLAGDSPFVVSYDTSKTPFEPVRFSRASISVVASEYFFDVFSEEAKGTQVILTNEDDNVVEWVGYLTSNLLNMPQDSCGAETFTLEAQDCLSTLEYYDYQSTSTAKTIVTFQQILGQIAERCGLITEMYVDQNLQRTNGNPITMNNLTVSEQNFYSSDTDEPWNLKEVLEELCKYLGYTAMQYRTSLILHDIQSHAGNTWNSGTTETDLAPTCYKYQKSSSWTASTTQQWSNIMKGVTLRQDIIRGTGSDISLETLYNKIQVKDSFYEIDHFVPDFFEDTLLTNRQGNFWNCSSIQNTGKLRYVNIRGNSKKEEKDESDYIHYIRKFNHRDYNSVYRNPTTLAEITSFSKILVKDVQQNQNDNNTAYNGIYKVTAKFQNTDSSSHTVKVYARLRYDWFDGDIQQPDYDDNTSPSTSITIPAGGSAEISASVITTHHERYSYTSTYESWYTLDGASTKNTLNMSSDGSADYVGATIVDLATFAKPMDTTKYNYETEADINFDRYIMIHQCDQPDMINPNAWIPGIITPLSDGEIESVFPAVMRLRSDYSNPMIINDNAYLALDATAIYERYNLEYINPDWTKECTGTITGLHIFNRTSDAMTMTPCLIFKLRIGDKYWSSIQNKWISTDCCFMVDLGTDKTDKDDTEFLEWWNKDHPVLNNVEWTDWAGAKGYKIPLDSSLCFSGGVEFDIMLPAKQQVITTHEKNDGINNYCWVKDLKIDFTTKDRENYDLSDIIYENIINSGSVNTLSDVTCKFTTYPGNGQHSYSSVGLDGVLMDNIKRLGLDNKANKCEEHIIKAYTNQYSFPTIKQTMTLDLSPTPISRIYDPVLGRYFAILGSEINYAQGSQRLSLIETRTWSVD